MNNRAPPGWWGVARAPPAEAWGWVMALSSELGEEDRNLPPWAAGPHCARLATLMGPHRNKDHWTSEKIETPKISRQASIWIPKIHCCCSVAQLCLTLWDCMDCSTPGFPAHHQFLELVQTHVHWVGDIIQPSYPLSPPSPPAFSLSQNQSFLIIRLFASGGQSIGASASVSVLLMNIQDWFPKYIASYVFLAKSLTEPQIPCLKS